jgi:cysteine desulfuration protein SufE
MNGTSAMTPPGIDEIVETLGLLDEWEERYRYLIELGRTLEALPDDQRTPENKVQGCVSQVWLHTSEADGVVHFVGDSDAHIVKGLVAILIALYSDRPAAEIIDRDALALFRELELEEHLTPQRSNGLKSMVRRMKDEARKVLVSSA